MNLILDIIFPRLLLHNGTEAVAVYHPQPDCCEALKTRPLTLNELAIVNYVGALNLHVLNETQ